MITLHFSELEMREALERAGYIIKDEKEVFTIQRVGNFDFDEECPVTNVYHEADPKPLAEWAGAGSKRLEVAFKHVLHKKLLHLF